MLSRERLTNILMSVIMSLLIVSIFGKTNFHIKAFEFEMYTEIFDHGVLEIAIPPVGTISSKTHQTPLKVGFILQNIDLDLLEGILESTPAQEHLLKDITLELQKILRIFSYRLLFLAALGGMLGPLILHRKKAASYIQGAVVGITVMAILLAGTYYTFKPENFKSPQYQGILKAAPWMVGLAEEAFARVNELGDQMQLMAGNLYNLFEKINNLEPIGTVNGPLKMLHISDIHNNPAAYGLIQQIVTDFNVNFIVDTGDLSDFGTPFEALLTKRLAELKLPYIFIPGNHDSPGTVKALKKYSNVTILDGESVEISGVKIFGMGDPASHTNDIAPLPTENINEYTKKAQELLKNTPVDIIAVHSPKMAQMLAGNANTILYGHDHRQSISMTNNSVLIDAGTSGAAGIRGLQTINEVPYTLVLLHLDNNGRNWIPVAADIIKVYNLSSNFSLERKILAP